MPKAEVGGDNEAAELDDVLQVGARHDFGHQRQYAVRRQLHHQAHQLHHPGLQGIDGGQNALAFGDVILQQLQRSDAEEGGKDNDADDGGRVSARQVGKRVLRHEGKDQLRNAEVRDLTDVVALNCVQAGGFRAPLYQPFGGQAKQVGHQHAHQGSDKGGEQQGANAHEADFTQLRSVVQARDGAQNRREHQRHDDHLQQLYVAVANDIEPLNGIFQYLAVGAVNQL